MGTFIKLIHCFSSYYDDIRECSSIKVSMIFFVAVLSGTHLCGQTISELGYLNLTSDNALIQHFVLGTDTGAVIYYNNGSNHYIIGSCNSYNFRYKLPQPITDEVRQIPCEINDMVLAGKTLFLCGNMAYISEEESYYTMSGQYLSVYDTCGFLMTIDVTDLVNPSSPNIRANYIELSNVTDCSQIAVLLAGSDTLIGIVCSDNNISCLACLTIKSPMGNSILKKYALPDTSEVLSDLTFTGKSFVTTSRFGGEPYLFGVRFTDPFELFYNEDLSNYNQLTKFNTSGMTCYYSTTTWHRNNATIHLADLDIGSEVVVGYDCHYYYTSGPNPTFSSNLSFFYVDGSDMWHPVVRSAKSLTSVPDILEVFRDMKYNTDDKSIAILRRSLCYNNFASGVTLFSWNGSNAREVFSINEDMNSFDLLKNNLIAVANPRNNDSLELFWKDTRYMTISCLQECVQPLCSYDVLPEPNYSTELLSDLDLFVNPRYRCTVKGKRIPYNIKCSRDIDDAINN